jgi:hypothetical protein
VTLDRFLTIVALSLLAQPREEGFAGKSSVTRSKASGDWLVCTSHAMSRNQKLVVRSNISNFVGKKASDSRLVGERPPMSHSCQIDM